WEAWDTWRLRRIVAQPHKSWVWARVATSVSFWKVPSQRLTANKAGADFTEPWAGGGHSGPFPLSISESAKDCGVPAPRIPKIPGNRSAASSRRIKFRSATPDRGYATG